MSIPLDLERLALRIERLVQTRAQDLLPGDDLDLRRSLPTPGTLRPGHLPRPEYLREQAATLRAGTKLSEDAQQALSAAYRQGIQVALRLESLVSRNDPRNPQRAIRDMMRGRFPGMR